MRGTFKKLMSRQAKRTAKRALLFAMLAATGISAEQSTALGQYPLGSKITTRNHSQTMPVKIVHRAPVKISNTAAGSVRSNRFVVATPPVPMAAPAIQLASGSEPSIRLKSTDHTVGFAPIGGEVPQVVNTPSIAAAEPAREPSALALNKGPFDSQPVPFDSQPGALAATAQPVLAIPSVPPVLESPNLSAGVSESVPTQEMPSGMGASGMQTNAFHQSQPGQGQPGQGQPRQGQPRHIMAPSVVGLPAMDHHLPSSAASAPSGVASPEPRTIDATPLVELGTPVPTPHAVFEGSASAESGSVETAAVDSGNAFAKHAIEASTPHTGTAIIDSSMFNGESQVVPVTDARDDQSAIQETQPIFFSLSDSSNAADAELDVDEPDESQQAVVSESVSMSSEESTEDTSAGDTSIGGGAADGAVYMATPELPTSLSLSDVADTGNETQPGFLSAVETPVHLSPVVTLAERLPSPVAGEASAIRTNPNMDGDLSIADVSLGMAESNSEPQVSRQAVAVTMPPTVITHDNTSGDFSPTVDGLAHDPTASASSALPDFELETSDSFDVMPPQVVVDSSQHLGGNDRLIDQVAENLMPENLMPENAIHVAVDAPRLNAGAVELPPPVTESIPPTLPVPPKVSADAASQSVAEETRQPRVQAQLASAQPADVSTTLGYQTNRRLATPGQSTAPRKPVVLNLSRAQVRSMTIAGRLRRVSIANKDVCQAFAAGANQLKLIGTGLGKTKLTIWADVAPGEPTRVQSFDIDVSNEVDAIGDKVSAHTALLNDSIDKAFPRASVVVSRQSGKLVVTGRCESEETAKQIVRMVRKSCLVPVQDDLLVR